MSKTFLDWWLWYPVWKVGNSCLIEKSAFWLWELQLLYSSEGRYVLTYLIGFWFIFHVSLICMTRGYIKYLCQTNHCNKHFTSFLLVTNSTGTSKWGCWVPQLCWAALRQGSFAGSLLLHSRLLRTCVTGLMGSPLSCIQEWNSCCYLVLFTCNK